MTNAKEITKLGEEIKSHQKFLKDNPLENFEHCHHEINQLNDLVGYDSECYAKLDRVVALNSESDKKQSELKSQCHKLSDYIKALNNELTPYHNIKHAINCENEHRYSSHHSEDGIHRCQQEHNTYLDLKQSLKSDVAVFEEFCS